MKKNIITTKIMRTLTISTLLVSAPIYASDAAFAAAVAQMCSCFCGLALGLFAYVPSFHCGNLGARALNNLCGPCSDQLELLETERQERQCQKEQWQREIDQKQTTITQRQAAIKQLEEQVNTFDSQQLQ